MNEFLRIASWLLTSYYASTNLIYGILLVQSICATLQYHRLLTGLWHSRMRTSPLTPPISILVPARNEEKSIVDSVRSLLALDYPELEVIVVNDGSTDDTLATLKQAFRLVETDILHVSEVPTSPIRGVYISFEDRRLLVLDKECCGRKADALNAALNAASAPFVCAIDADAVLEKDSLLRIMTPALNNPTRVIASGGIVRAANGSLIENGIVKRICLPRKPIEALQVLEYLRSFLIGRQGWAHMDMLLIVSGAFGVFRRDMCREIGGFRTSAIGEDMDLIVRLHRHARAKKQKYTVAFVPDPVCWTEVPSNLKSLARQRARWQNGLADVLWQNRGMLFNPSYGRIGLVAVPYQWIFELVAPVLEAFGWICLAIAAALHLLGGGFWVIFLLFGYVASTLLSLGSVLLEEMVYHRYNDWSDLLRLVGFCFLEPFWYRPLNTIWRLQGLWHFLAGRNSWQLIQRTGFSTPGCAIPAPKERKREAKEFSEAAATIPPAKTRPAHPPNCAAPGPST
jgi:cellulose synthase/poly-beta-1,6-N-acetylglucosamine synthase-like glycosyltransferase